MSGNVWIYLEYLEVVLGKYQCSAITLQSPFACDLDQNLPESALSFAENLPEITAARGKNLSEKQKQVCVKRLGRRYFLAPLPTFFPRETINPKDD